MSSRDYSYLSLVLEADPDHYVHDEDIYEFSNGRKFKIDDHNQSAETGGVYGITAEGAVYWDDNMVGMEWDAGGDTILWDDDSNENP